LLKLALLASWILTALTIAAVVVRETPVLASIDLYTDLMVRHEMVKQLMKQSCFQIPAL